MRTLIVDQQYRPIQVLPWQRAITLTFTLRGEALVYYENLFARTISQSYPVPAVVRMVEPIIQRRHHARFTRDNVLTRDQNMCQYCGCKRPSRELTMDHVVPRTQGGKSSWTNIVAACETCNRRKGGRTPEQAGLILKKKPIRPLWSVLVGMRGFLCTDPHPAWGPFLR